jgi:hypothetical protein
MDYFEFRIRIPKKPWQWIRFRITTILLLIAIAAMALAWRHDHQQLSNELYQLRNPGPHWEAAQATGPPNTAAGDGMTAWCPLTADDQQEWLVLEYSQAVVPNAIIVHANHNPGAVRRVTHYPKLGVEQTLWEGDDPTLPTAAAGVSRLPATGRIKTKRIKIYIDSPAVPDWNEIDAVGLEYGDDKKVIWAERAMASSSYGEGNQAVFQSGGGYLFR